MQLLQNACCRSFHIRSRSAKGRHVGVGGPGVDGSLGVTGEMVYMDQKKTNIKTEEESFMMHVCILTNENLWIPI